MRRTSWRRRSALLACVSALLCVPAAPAQADEFIDVWACLGPDNVPVRFDGFTKLTTIGVELYDDDCAVNDPLDPHAQIFLSGSYSNGARSGWRLVEPHGLDIVEAAWRGTLSDAGRGRIGHWAAQIVAGGVPRYSQAGPLGLDLRQQAIPSAAGDVALQMQAQSDGAVADDLRLGIMSWRVRLADRFNPTASGARGTATMPGYKSGAVTLAFDAADVGAGLQRSRLTIDEVGQPSEPFAGNLESCRPVGTSPTGYTVAVPCRTAITASRTIDTTTLADGRHTVQLLLTDAARNEAVAWTGDLRVNNPGGALPDTACADGVDNDLDGTVDAGHDAGCSGPGDTDETAPPTRKAPPTIAGSAWSGHLVARVAGTWDNASIRSWASIDASDTRIWFIPAVRRATNNRTSKTIPTITRTSDTGTDRISRVMKIGATNPAALGRRGVAG